MSPEGKCSLKFHLWLCNHQLPLTSSPFSLFTRYGEINMSSGAWMSGVLIPKLSLQFPVNLGSLIPRIPAFGLPVNSGCSLQIYLPQTYYNYKILIIKVVTLQSPCKIQYSRPRTFLIQPTLQHLFPLHCTWQDPKHSQGLDTSSVCFSPSCLRSRHSFWGHKI